MLGVNMLWVVYYVYVFVYVDGVIWICATASECNNYTLIINSLCAKFFLSMYLHFMSFLHTEMP